MNILEEYQLQQTWRNWEQYLAAIPFSKTDRALDLGCSIGEVSNLFSHGVAKVTGIDLNAEFIAHCQTHQKLNQQFICCDFTTMDYSAIAPVNGIWISFAISYVAQPEKFLAILYELLEPGDWIAIVDIACFISGNMLPDSKYYSLVKQFEVEAYKAGVYDFNVGEKIEHLLLQTGFTLIHTDNNITDKELNFTGAAEAEIVRNWEARLARMHGLKTRYPNQYSEICAEIISSLKSASHTKNNNVRFIVALKSQS